MKHLIYLFACSMVLSLLSPSNLLQAQPFEEPVSDPFELSAPGQDTLVSVRLMDIDNDGHLEAFVVKALSNPPFTATVDYYEFSLLNSGTFEFVETFPFNMPVAINYNLHFADIDGDDDYDLFYNQTVANGHVGFAKNIGSPEDPLFSDTLEIDPFGMVMAMSPMDGDTVDFAYPTFADLDDDGDLDFFLNGGWLNGEPDETFMYYENTGTATMPIFGMAALDTFGLSLPVPATHLTELKDLDCDGDLDLFINIGGNLNFYYYLNEGDTLIPAFGASEQEPWNTDSKFKPAFGTFTDFDGDGDLDLFCGGNASIYYFENLAPEPCSLLIDGIENVRLEGSLELYPNPTSDHLQIVFESENIRNKVAIEIFDLVGVQVRRSTFQVQGSSFVESFSLEGLPGGIYTIIISSGEKFLGRKFVKMR